MAAIVGFMPRLDRRLTFNTSVFYYDFTNQQFRAPATGVSPCPGSANPIGTALLNTIAATMRTEELLKQSQALAEELQSQ